MSAPSPMRNSVTTLVTLAAWPSERCDSMIVPCELAPAAIQLRMCVASPSPPAVVTNSK